MSSSSSSSNKDTTTSKDEKTPLLPLSIDHHKSRPTDYTNPTQHRPTPLTDSNTSTTSSTRLQLLAVVVVVILAVVAFLAVASPLFPHHLPPPPSANTMPILSQCLTLPDRSKFQLSSSNLFLTTDSMRQWRWTAEESPSLHTSTFTVTAGHGSMSGCYKLQSAYHGEWKIHPITKQIHLMKKMSVEEESDYFAFLPVLHSFAEKTTSLQGASKKDDETESEEEKRQRLARQHRQLIVDYSSSVHILHCQTSPPSPSQTDKEDAKEAVSPYWTVATTSSKSATDSKSLSLLPILASTSLHREDSNTAVSILWRMDVLVFQAGVNLGGYFIPEVWMNPSFFRDTGLGWSGSLCTMHTNNSILTEQRMLHQLQTSLTIEDIRLMAKLGFRSIRVPLGYWNVVEDPYHRYSPASLQISQKYLHQLMQWTAEYNISVLLDLHGLPGSQNGIDHSGCSIFPQWLVDRNHPHKADNNLVEHGNNVLLSLQAVEAIMQDYSQYVNFLGIELANEPSLMYYDNVTWSAAEQRVNRTGQYFDQMLAYYQSAYELIRKYHPSCFVYINELYSQYYDIWTELLASNQARPHQEADKKRSKATTKTKRSKGRRLSSMSATTPSQTDHENVDIWYKNVIIDFHLYNWQLPYTFESATQHLQDAKQLQDVIEVYMAHYPIVIGEWCMSTGTHLQVGQRFVNQSLHSFQSAFGSYLWTWKLDRNIGFDTWDVQYQAQVLLEEKLNSPNKQGSNHALNPFPAYQ